MNITQTRHRGGAAAFVLIATLGLGVGSATAMVAKEQGGRYITAAASFASAVHTCPLQSQGPLARSTQWCPPLPR